MCFFKQNGKNQVSQQLVAQLQVITIKIPPSDALGQKILKITGKLAQYSFEANNPSPLIALINFFLQKFYFFSIPYF